MAGFNGQKAATDGEKGESKSLRDWEDSQDGIKEGAPQGYGNLQSYGSQELHARTSEPCPAWPGYVGAHLKVRWLSCGRERITVFPVSKMSVVRTIGQRVEP
jgi:hypothetical protein